MAEKKSRDGGGDILINVSEEERSTVSSKSSKEMEFENVIPIKESFSYKTTKLTGSPNKPRPGLAQRKSFAKSVYSKPKSRFVDPSSHVDTSIQEEKVKVQHATGFSFNRDSPNRSVESTTQLTSSKAVVVEKDEDGEIFRNVKLKRTKYNKISKLAWIESAFLVVILSALIASLTIDTLKNHNLWGLNVWQWCVFLMVIFSGMLVTKWLMRGIVFLVETNKLLTKKVLYFVHRLRKSIHVFIWLILALVSWVLLFSHNVKRSHNATKILHYITKTLISLLMGAFFWLVKSLLLEIMAATFNVVNFFDRIQDSLFHQYVLQTLSAPPLIKGAERVAPELRIQSIDKKKTVVLWEKMIYMRKLHKLKRENVTDSTMQVLVEAVRSSGLSTMPNTLDESDVKADTIEITSENEALAAAYHVFRNVAQPSCDYIDEHDLLRFMDDEEVQLVFSLFDGIDETEKITRKAFNEWVLTVYKNRRALTHALSDTKTGIKQLKKLLTAILIVIVVVIWLLLLEVATIKVLLFFSSQLVALAFIIGSTCKNLFESIVFVFVTHPYDVGDRCVIDGVPMLVDEMNLLTTVFLKLDNEKVYYPNAVLATKPISNYFRSPHMGETIEFSIAFSTPESEIENLKEKIDEHLKKNSQHWSPTHIMVVNEMENMNKLKIALYSYHTITFQDYGERNIRRTKLVLAIKRILEELHIDYTLLPQQVLLINNNKTSNF